MHKNETNYDLFFFFFFFYIQTKTNSSHDTYYLKIDELRVTEIIFEAIYLIRKLTTLQKLCSNYVKEKGYRTNCP